MIAIVIALDADSRDSFGALLIAVPIWFLLAGVWFVRFVVALGRDGSRMSVAHWARWLMIPIAMGLVFLLTRTDALFDARLSLSRGAMDVMAADVMAGGSTDRGWVGLYDVGVVERTANGFRFVVDEGWLSRQGFAYSPDGEPSLTEENYSPLWTGASLEAIGGGWWYWSEAWD